MYTTFIRPILKYASVVSDGCNRCEMEKKEKLQFFAAGIRTGLPTIGSKTSFYSETGWILLLTGEKCPN